MFASRTCLRSLKDVGLVGGMGDRDEVDDVSARVETGFIKSSDVDEGAASTFAFAGVGLTVSAEALEELAVAVKAGAGAELSTILMGTRRRFGAAVEEVMAAGSKELVNGAEPRGGEATSIGMRFYHTSTLLMVQDNAQLYDIPSLHFLHGT